ncbi:hypothetical protein [Pontibacter liquoris]|uniref:hypothetical protein n=1 Tax=Pontibacter liquoris TaxID=2905677 RepID=UPI001FA71BAE|nr:hypothetical protein [Pontibacter liquoris]
MRKAILILWCFVLIQAAQAQTKLVFDEATPTSFLMKKGNGTGSQATINSIVGLLDTEGAQPQQGGRPNRSPEFVVRLEQQARITDLGDQLQLKVLLGKPAVSGDVNYKGFDLGEVLLPEKYNATVKLLNSRNQLVRTFTPSISISANGGTLLETTIPDTAVAQGYKLKLEAPDVVYTATTLARLQERVELVRAYYAADAALNAAQLSITRILPDDVDRLPQHDRNLRQVEEMLAGLRKAAFHDKLNLRQNDPQRLSARMQQFGQQVQERRRAIDHTMATLDEQFYNRGVALLHAGNQKGAQAYFVKATEANPKFAPAHAQLARLDYVNGYIREATARTRDILTHMRVDPETEAATLGLANDIYSTYIRQGNDLTSRGSYREALAAYADARDLCSTVGGLRCNLPALHDGIGRASYGVYRGMVEEGRQLLARHELAGAGKAAQNALAFQREYDEVLHEAPEAAQLQHQVTFQVYLQHINQGKRLLSQKNYEGALSQFDAALDLEQRNNLKPVQELDQLVRQAAKPVLLRQLGNGYEQALNNRLSEAREVAATATAMQSRYALENDPDVQSKYNLLRSRIFTQECFNAQATYDKHFKNGSTLANQKQFIAADQAFKAAVDVIAANASCGIATFTARQARETIAPAVAYQQLLSEADRYVASSRYTEAIQTYNEADQYYVAHSINNFGLDHISLYNYARTSTKQPFTASVVNYLAGVGQEEAAVQLLAILLENGYRRGKTNRVQEQLGRQLAVKDARRSLNDAADVLAARYTGNKKDLKKLGKAYEKEMKTQRKNS